MPPSPNTAAICSARKCVVALAEQAAYVVKSVNKSDGTIMYHEVGQVFTETLDDATIYRNYETGLVVLSNCAGGLPNFISDVVPLLGELS